MRVTLAETTLIQKLEDRLNVTFIIFNRPDTTEAVFNAIRRAKPDKLFVIADTPPRDDAKNLERCALVRKIVEVIDWDCQVYRNYADEHMGLQKRIPSGLSWVFEQVPDSIILEDDCLPHPSFFPYCSALLDRYRDDERVMSVLGDNFQQGVRRGEYSYYFSKYFYCWGWATWARAWRHFDQSLSGWPKFRDSGGLECWCLTLQEKLYWTEALDRELGMREIPGWDWCYHYACWAQSGLSIAPNVNLVSNIGFGPEGTHALDAYSCLANIPTEDIGELSHPPFVVRNEQADQHHFEHVCLKQPRLVTRMKLKLAKLLGTGTRSMWVGKP